LLNHQFKKNIIELVKILGNEVEKIKSSPVEFVLKEDNSPLTLADSFINIELNKFLSNTQFTNIISEENNQVPFSTRSKWDYFWMIDPIDGTKEFINQNSDYTLNIALCKTNIPIFSIVYAPARGELYHAEKNEGAFKNGNKINTAKLKSNILNVVASRSHINKSTQFFINKLQVERKINLLKYGSSLKICKVAEGDADIYPRFGPTMEWDTCAAQLILEEAGGFVQDVEGKPLRYNKQNLLNNYFLASGHEDYIV
jgi:3'(2'), 5'-bisphosphate nucleotidase